MMGRIWNIYVVELSKALRLKYTYAGPVLVVLTVLCTPLLAPITRDSHGDYGFIVYATSVSLNLLGLVLLLAYCASLVSSELGRGTARLMLVRPVLRSDFLAAKLLLGMSYAAALVIMVAVVSWALVLLFGDFGGVNFGGEVLFTSTQMAGAYVLAMLLSLFPLFTTVAYAIMVSAVTRSSAAAIGCAVGIWLLVDTLKHPLRIAPFWFSSYFEAPWQVFAQRAEGLSAFWLPDAYYCVGVSIAWMAVFIIVAGVSLQHRNLQG